MGDMTDRNVEAVRAKLAERAATGLRKYGTTTERKDLTPLQWLQHLQDELMDASVYVEVLMRTFAVEPSPPTTPDHGAKLVNDAGFCRIKRRQNGVDEWLSTEGTWHPFISDASWGDAPSALRALAKATGWEIRAVPAASGSWMVQSGEYVLDTVNGKWSKFTISVEHAAAKLIAEALEARGDYPEPMCDRGEVGNG